MVNFAELMQRLLEIQSGGRHRSPELVAEDERLIDGLQKRILPTSPQPDCRAQANLRQTVRADNAPADC
jgi:hypothetical protein